MWGAYETAGHSEAWCECGIGLRGKPNGPHTRRADSGGRLGPRSPHQLTSRGSPQRGSASQPIRGELIHLGGSNEGHWCPRRKVWNRETRMWADLPVTLPKKKRPRRPFTARTGCATGTVGWQSWGQRRAVLDHIGNVAQKRKGEKTLMKCP